MVADCCLVLVFFIFAGKSCNDLTIEYRMVGMFYSGKSFQNDHIYILLCVISPVFFILISLLVSSLLHLSAIEITVLYHPFFCSSRIRLS